ncbi:hypothetical protein EH245_07285 [Bifidobacterium breve]|nr:hypothetical protein [Bifidobacterium sp. M3-N-101]AZI17629.1 hypothetical protein EH245_07285 [Bifidobacterium breve]
MTPSFQGCAVRVAESDVWESVSQQVDQRRDSFDYALTYLLERESMINPFDGKMDRLTSDAAALFAVPFLP